MPRQRGLAFERLYSAERAARLIGESVARWWSDVEAEVETALTDEALDGLLHDQLTSLARAFGAEAVSVLVASEAEDELVARASVGPGAGVNVALHLRRGEGVAGRVLEERRPLVISSLSEIPVPTSALVGTGLQSFVAAPMLVGERILGVLNIGSVEPAQFEEADAEATELVAHRLALTFERVRLFETERAARQVAEDARQRVEQLAARIDYLRSIASALASALGVDDVVSIVLDALAREPISASGVGVWLERSGRLARHRVARRHRGLSGLPASLSLADEHPIAIAARTRRALYLAPDSALALCTGATDEGLSAPVGVYACVPLLLGTRVPGIVVVFRNGSEGFGAAERELIHAAADQGGPALERALLYEDQVRLLGINAFMSRTARVLAEAEASGFVQTLDSLATLALPVLGDICVIDVLDADGNLRRVVARHLDPARQHLVDRLRDEFVPDPLRQHPAVEVIHSRRTRWSEEMTEELLRATTRNEEHYQLTRELGFSSYISVPLAGGDEVLGSLTFVSSHGPFDSDDVEFAEMLADQVAAVVANASRFESTTRTSRELQESLLPSELPTVPGLELESRYVAATEGLEVGGDFYDAVLLSASTLVFAIGDVEGHDRRAAALMGQLRSAIRALSGGSDDPAELVVALDRSWEFLGFERLATALFGRLDLRSWSLSIASVGHYPPLLVSRGGAAFLSVVPSPPFGATPREPELFVGELGVGDVLLLYTDGAIDERVAGVDASMAELAATVAGAAPGPRAICDAVLRGLHGGRVDDVALLALHRIDQPPPWVNDMPEGGAIAPGGRVRVPWRRGRVA